MQHSRVMDLPLFLKFKYKPPAFCKVTVRGSLIYLGCCRVALQTFKNLERGRMQGEGGEQGDEGERVERGRGRSEVPAGPAGAAILPHGEQRLP